MANINGTSHDDSILGTRFSDVIHGGNGNDKIGDRTHLSHVSNDWFYGDAGDDVLASLSGKDHLDGGSGKDRFYAANEDDLTIVGGAGHDAVTIYGIEKQYIVSVFDDHVEYERHDRTGLDYKIELYGVEHVHFSLFI